MSGRPKPRSVALASLIVVAATAAAQPLPPRFDQLANLTYNFGPKDQRVVTLKNGTGTLTEDDIDSVFDLMKLYAVGDLDGDKTPDAAAILGEHSGGTGHFYYLFVFLNRGGRLVQIEYPEWLGDRSVIQGVEIRKAVLGVKFVTHRDSDPACCPTRRVENRYRVVNGTLVGLR